MDNKKEEIGEIYKKLDATYSKLIGKANEKIKMIDDLIGVDGVCHFFNDKRPGEEEINKFVEELLKFAIKSLRENESDHVCVKSDKSYPLLYKYLNGLSLQRNAFCTDWGYDLFKMS